MGLLALPARLTIRWKITLFYSGLLALLLVGFSLYLYFSVEQLLLGNINQTLEAHFKQSWAASPQITAELSAPPASSNTGELPSGSPVARHLATLDSLSGPKFFLQVLDSRGRVIATTTNLANRFLPTPAVKPSTVGEIQKEQIRLPVAGFIPAEMVTDLKQVRFEMRSVLLLNQNGQIVGLLQEAHSLFEVDQIQDNLVDVVERGLLVVLLIAILVGLWLAGSLLKPITRLTSIARQIGTGSDLSRRVASRNKPIQDEVGKLAGAFNAMLERLERSFNAQQQFVEDASHELKTPLTAILGHANLLRRRGRASPELVEESSVAIIEEAERLRRLTQDLLYLARVGQSHQLPMEIVSLDQVVVEVVRELQLLAGEKAIELTSTTRHHSGSNSYLVYGDSDKLKQLLLNLVDNALKFTPRGGTISIETALEVSPRGQEVVVKVRDNGQGIEATELPHIFERFYRIDKARSRREQEGGSGLGLAIVQEVARQHGGRVEVKSEPRKGSVFSLKLPASVTSK